MISIATALFPSKKAEAAASPGQNVDSSTLQDTLIIQLKAIFCWASDAVPAENALMAWMNLSSWLQDILSSNVFLITLSRQLEQIA